MNGDGDELPLGDPKAAQAPAPSTALLSALQAMKPVRTRVPARALLAVGGAALVYPLAAFSLLPLRRDLGALPPLWVAAAGLLWLAGFVVPLLLAVIPRRGHVLPDGARAGRAALLAGLALVLLGLLFTVDVPGLTILPATTWDGFLRLWWHCVSFGLEVSVPTIVLGAVALRRVAVVSAARLGAAVGAAGGSLAGFTLHGLCPYGGAPHVGLAHGGGVVVGALLGALWLPLLVSIGGPRRGYAPS